GAVSSKLQENDLGEPAMMADNGHIRSVVLLQCDSTAAACRSRACAGPNPGLGPILLTMSGLTGRMGWLANILARPFGSTRKQAVTD
ncbi:MAG: hypothetical protein Q8O63_09005, partial [Hoeflea sp.]|nr:hypothetical protein [Hoeflea sp.]